MRGGIIIFKETITSCSEALCGSLLFILVFKIKKNYINFRWIHDGWLLEYWAFPNSNSMPSRLYCAIAIFHIKKWITWTESQSLDLQSCEISSRFHRKYSWFHKEWPICTMLNSHDWCWVRNVRVRRGHQLTGEWRPVWTHQVKCKQIRPTGDKQNI